MEVRLLTRTRGAIRGGTALLLLLAAAIFLIQAFAYREYLIDDAYISLRYARNLVEGHGLVFNPGERVEGYSNFLWVILAAGWLRLGIEPMFALKMVSVVAALLTVWLTLQLSRLVGLVRPFLSVLFLIPLQSFAYWSTTGMETMAFTLLIVSCVYFGLLEGREKRRPLAAILFLLLALLRPEGAAFFALCTVAFAGADRLRTGTWHLRIHSSRATILATGYGAYLVWRHTYYGDWLPNTYFAKVTGGAEQLTNGWINLRQWAVAHPLIALALVLPVLWLHPRLRSTSRLGPELLAIWCITLGWVGYVVSIGGDFMPFFRFFLPILPLAALLLAWSLEAARAAVVRARPDLPHRRFAMALVMLWVVHLGANLATPEPVRAFVSHRTTVVGEIVGDYLARRQQPEDLIAANTVGSLPYSSRLPTLDTLGLTDAAIARHPIYIVSPLWGAHRRGWGDYVLRRQPEVILWYNSAGSREPHYLGDHQLADNPYFRFFYQARTQQLPAAGPREPVAAWFLGAPFGSQGHVSTVAPELGTTFTLRPLIPGIPYPTVTFASESPIRAHFFEIRRDAEVLWRHTDEGKRDLEAFLDQVIEIWASSFANRSPVSSEARRQVDELCDRALRALETEDLEAAKSLLAEAAAHNGSTGSPRVFQYVANLAVLEKNLFLAVQAQREALRLDPGSRLYRSNLLGLLRVPYKQFKEASTGRWAADTESNTEPG